MKSATFIVISFVLLIFTYCKLIFGIEVCLNWSFEPSSTQLLTGFADSQWVTVVIYIFCISVVRIHCQFRKTKGDKNVVDNNINFLTVLHSDAL